MSVQPGYEIGRDQHGLTSNEREVLGRLARGATLTEIAQEMELSRQRTFALATDLVRKGWLYKGEKRGSYMIEAKKLPVILNFWRDSDGG